MFQASELRAIFKSRKDPFTRISTISHIFPTHFQPGQ